MAKTIFMRDGSTALMFHEDDEGAKREFARILKDKLGDDAEAEFLRQFNSQHCWDCSLCDPDDCQELEDRDVKINGLEEKVRELKQENEALRAKIREHEETDETVRGYLNAAIKTGPDMDGKSMYLLQRAYEKLGGE